MMERIEEEFRDKGTVRGGELMLRPSDALAFVNRCRDRRVEVLGVDGFHLTETTIQPDMGESIDLSDDLDGRAQCWDRAEEFLLERVGSDLFFKVVVDET